MGGAGGGGEEKVGAKRWLTLQTDKASGKHTQSKPANNFCQQAGHLSGQGQVFDLTRSQSGRTKHVFPSEIYTNCYYGPVIELKCTHFVTKFLHWIANAL